MIHRKRTICCARLLCAFAAVFALIGVAWSFALPSACAEEQISLEIGMTVKPEELVGPGDTVLTFTITNVTSGDARNIYLSSPDGSISEPVGQIAAGETQTFTRVHSVTEEELESGIITYVISHDAGWGSDEKTEYIIQASVQKSEPKPTAEFTRRISSRFVSPGNTLTVTYCVRNTGNVALNALSVQDALGDFIGRIERLEIGESRTLISRVTIADNAVSSAALSYSADMTGDTVFEQRLTDEKITLAEGHIDAELSADYTAFRNDAADVVLVLSNTGNVDYRDITVSDDINGGVIADNVSVPCNSDPVEVSCTYPVRGDSGFRWRVSGVSAAGDRIDFVTDTVLLAEKEAMSPDDISLQAYTDTPRIRRTGNVTIHVHIENSGDADVTDAKLSEESLGEVRTFTVIPAGGTIDRDVTVQPVDSTDYRFSLCYTDAEGWIRSIDAENVEIVMAPDGVLPDGAKTGLIEFTGSSVKIGGSKLYASLLIAGSVVLIVLIVILLIATRRARLEKQLRIAAARRRRKAQSLKGGRKQPGKKENGRR